MIISIFLLTSVATAWRLSHDKGGFVAVAPESVLTYLSTLPKDILVATYPEVADDIPIRARRSVLVMKEMIYPMHREYYSEMLKRADLVEAMFEDFCQSTLRQLRDEYSVDTIVIDANRFVESDTSIIENINRDGESAVLFRAGDYFILDLEQILSRGIYRDC